MIFTLATLSALVVPATVLIVAAVVVGRQIAGLQRRAILAGNWTSDLSVERYRPMFRLLDNEDLHFLRSQPGVTPALLKRLRKQRSHVFRGYLRSLERDFRLASDALLLVMVQSPTDRADLIARLLLSRLKFSAGMAMVRGRLCFYSWNLGSSSVARLVGLLETMQSELISLQPEQSGAPA